ncbi:uncharacterized protein TRAVEDRAFT_41095 [Trametes versicolor FP-101664 SS1]|uniref:DUF6818 domain-containing protein n=2 Tax=Trametes versicolor (strain FP-101664) TaxID=717944 RepID=R7S6B3_TRAVS|nr:uncharacterized protein TRAVEDRAFT_41095 [Trametes versicolor FP-101664 SS1]EIW51376.1 hypothetical protein TRAVEDRAFT_41095 [Trametes versicolor FP-101664 SS1]
MDHPSASDLQARPGPSHPPRPRPVYRAPPAFPPSAAPAPATFEALPSFNAGFPPGPPGPHPFIFSHTFPPSFGSQHTQSAGPPSPSPTASGSRASAPVHPPFLRSESSSREGSPELRGAHHPAPAQPNPTAVTSKSDKGKKRALEHGTSSVAKKPRVAPKPKAAPPRLSAKAKGKQVVRPPAALPQSHNGRQPGASNYTDEDMDALLDLVEVELPIGQNAWQRITDDFNSWARENGRPPRTQKPLKTKYDTLVRTPKPTGSASVPANVERAWEIEEHINEKIHLGVLDDGDIADNNEEVNESIIEVDDEASNSEVEIVDPPVRASAKERGLLAASARKPFAQPVMKGFRDQATASTARAAASSRRAQAQDFMSAVTTSLDPAARNARDDARYARRFAQDELQRLSSDNRDLRTRNDTLTDRLHQQSTEVARLQSRLDMMEMMQAAHGNGRRRHDDWDTDGSPRPRRPRSYARRYSSPPPPPMSPPRIIPSACNVSMHSPSPSRSYPARERQLDASPIRHFAGSTPRSGIPPPPSLSAFTFTPTASGSSLDTLAAAASTSTAHHMHEQEDAPSVTLTFTSPQRRRDWDAGSHIPR